MWEIYWLSVWVTRPERPKEELKQARMAATQKWGPEGPQTSSSTYYHFIFSLACVPLQGIAIQVPTVFITEREPITGDGYGHSGSYDQDDKKTLMMSLIGLR